MINILFVCMGNICRSPSAEGFFIKALQQSKHKDQILTDSAGTHGYHVGHAPDPRAAATALESSVDISQLRARKVHASDFENFDLIIAMDQSNYNDLQRVQPANSRASVEMMMQYHPQAEPAEVPDPYYGGMDGFTYMCELLDSATNGLLKSVEGQLDK